MPIPIPVSLPGNDINDTSAVTDPALSQLAPNGDDTDEPAAKRPRLEEPSVDAPLDDEAVLALADHGSHPSSVEHYPAE